MLRSARPRVEELEQRALLTAELVNAFSLGNSGFQAGLAVATDASGDVYVTGTFEGTIDFDPGEGTELHTSTGQAEPDMFVAKYARSGALAWTKSFPDSSGGRATADAIALDAVGNVYLTGHFAGTVDFDPDSGSFPLSSTGGAWDMFVLKLEPDGALTWAKAIRGYSVYERGFDLKVDEAQNVYVVGQFDGTVDFDPDGGRFDLTADSYDAFVLKLDINGALVWACQTSGPGVQMAHGIALDSSGNLLICGGIGGTADFDPGVGVNELIYLGGDRDAFVWKLTNSGDFVWARVLNSGFFEIAQGIAIDSADNIYTTGPFDELIDVDPGSGQFFLVGDGIFVSKLDSNGAFVWGKRLGVATSYPLGDADAPHRLAINASGKLFVAGYFRAVVDVDPGPDTYLLFEHGNGDVFVTSLDVDGNFMGAASFGGGDVDVVNGIAVPGDTGVYVTGQWYSASADFDPGPGIRNINGDGGSDFFLSHIRNFTGANLIATGTDQGKPARVRVFNAITQQRRFTLLPFGSSFKGGVRVAVGDVNRDGTPDVITAPGPGREPHVRIFDGRTGAMIAEFLAYDPSFKGGVFLAVGDLDGDGSAEIVTGPGQGMKPQVRVFRGIDGQRVAKFFAFDAGFQGGVSVAVGDVDGDGQLDLVTGKASGAAAVRIFTGDGSAPLAGPLGSFLAFNSKRGVSIAAGDVDGDGIVEIVTGDGASPTVRVFSRNDLAGSRQFQAFDADLGVRVGVVDADSDGVLDILAALGPGSAPTVRQFDGETFNRLAAFSAEDELFRGGLFVAGGQ